MPLVQIDLFGQPSPPDEAGRLPQDIHRFIDALIAEHGDNFAIVVSMSGGKDSVMALGYIHEHYAYVKTYVVMADTGFEHVKPISAVDWARARCADFGYELHVVRNPNKTYLEMVERRGKFPSKGQRQCTSDLKRGPIHKFIRNLSERVIVSVEGIRGQESTDRKNQKAWERLDDLSIPERRARDGKIWQQARQVYRWLPIKEESLQDVLDWHKQKKIPLHPVYLPEYHWDGTTGGYLDRFSCRLCIFLRPEQIKAVYHHDREAFDAVSGLEQKTGFTMKNGKSLLQIVGQVPTDHHLLEKETLTHEISLKLHE